VVFNPAIDLMLESNDQSARILSKLNVKACTDVTGFGLLGHLNELCLASKCAARLNLNSIPLLKGVEELVLKEIKSSLYSQNRKAFGEMEGAKAEAITQQARFKVLFDPQTSGGLLAGIPADSYANLDEAFHQQFFTVGDVVDFNDSSPRIKIE
jgi:selenide,water dikinase